MSLITCPDCRTPVSDRADACLKCGRRMRYWTPGRIILAIILVPVGLIFFLTLFGWIFGLL